MGSCSTRKGVVFGRVEGGTLASGLEHAGFMQGRKQDSLFKLS